LKQDHLFLIEPYALRVITAAFSIIGPYITQNKGQEIHKDFYAFVFFCIAPANLLKDLEKGSVSVYFAGGADIFSHLIRRVT
jgi:hypothetical protein